MAPFACQTRLSHAEKSSDHFEGQCRPVVRNAFETHTWENEACEAKAAYLVLPRGSYDACEAIARSIHMSTLSPTTNRALGLAKPADPMRACTRPGSSSRASSGP